jgi:hypothetical protein
MSTNVVASPLDPYDKKNDVGEKLSYIIYLVMHWPKNKTWSINLTKKYHNIKNIFLTSTERPVFHPPTLNLKVRKLKPQRQNKQSKWSNMHVIILGNKHDVPRRETLYIELCQNSSLNAINRPMFELFMCILLMIHAMMKLLISFPNGFCRGW